MGYQPKRCQRKARTAPALRLPAAVLLLVLVLTGSWSVLSNHVDARHDAGDPPRQKLERQQVPAQTTLPAETAAAPSATPAVMPQPAETAPPAASQPEGSAPVTETEAAQGYDYSVPVPQGEAVDNDWFADAAFLGDSLTDGLLLYSDIKGPAHLSYKGLTVQSVRTDKVIRLNGQKYTPLEALGKKTYGKVYILLGINELGWHNDRRFYDGYAQLIDLVRAAQPDARIYLQTLLPVTAEKSESHQWLKNEKVAVYNDLITQLAGEKGVYLVDAHAALADENDALPADESVDGVHLTKAGYQRWADYLRTHTAAPENP